MAGGAEAAVVAGPAEDVDRMACEADASQPQPSSPASPDDAC
jgi:hypothetical protein